MLSRKMRRTMNRRSRTQRFATLPGAPIQLATVTSVTPGDGSPGSASAVVDFAGLEYDLPSVGGYLPPLGATVPLLMNGGDPISLLQGVMVDGDMQSRDFIPGVSGWRISANGDAEFNSAIIRAEIVAEEFATSADPVAEGGIFIATTTGLNTIVLRRPGTLEAYPARIVASSDHLRLEGTDDRARIRLYEDGRAQMIGNNVSLSSTAGDIELSSVGQVLAGFPGEEHDLLKWPAREVSGFQVVTTGTITIVTITASVMHNLLPDGSDAVVASFTAGVGTLSPRKTGYWLLDVDGTFSYPASGEYRHQIGYRFNAGGNVWMDNGQTNTLANAEQAPMSFTKKLFFNGTSDVVRVLVQHARGSNSNFDMRSMSLTFLHA